MRCHIIFDININTFKRKARYLSGGNMTEPPSSITYTSVVSRESVHISLMMDDLNELDVLLVM